MSAQRELKHLDLIEALRHQEQDLDPALGRPALVAMLKTNQGKPVTVASWLAGAPVLLPETDLIGFSSADGEPLGIFTRQSLPRIQELRGEAVAIWGPRRVRYEGFPTAEQLGRLERFATAEQMKSIQAPGQLPSGGAETHSTCGQPPWLPRAPCPCRAICKGPAWASRTRTDAGCLAAAPAVAGGGGWGVSGRSGSPAGRLGVEPLPRPQASVVLVRGHLGGIRVHQGSGVVVAPGLVATNAHVAQGALGLTVQQGAAVWPVVQGAPRPPAGCLPADGARAPGAPG